MRSRTRTPAAPSPQRRSGSVLAPIAERNPTLNAIIELRAEGVLSDAAQADEALGRSERVGSLHGVPITIKEAFDATGCTPRGGNPRF